MCAEVFGLLLSPVWGTNLIYRRGVGSLADIHDAESVMRAILGVRWMWRRTSVSSEWAR